MGAGGRRGRPRSRRPGDAPRRQRRGALPDDAGLTVVRVGSTAELETRARARPRCDGASRRLRCPGDGRRRRRLPAGDRRRRKLARGDGADPRARADAGPARRGRRIARGSTRRADARRSRRSRPGRLRRRDRLARAGRREAPRKGVDLLVANDVAEPGSGFGTDTNRVSILGRGRLAGATSRCSASARSPTASWIGSPRRWTSATRAAQTGTTRPAASGASMSATADTAPPPDRRRHRQAVRRRRRASPMLTAYDFPTAQLARRGRDPAAAGRRFAGPGRCSATRRRSA